MRNGLVSLVGIVLVVAAALVATIVAGFRPLLGIDLTGGVEVVLQAADDPNRIAPPTDAELDQAVQILRNRVDALDVAQPDITRQGARVVVQLPDVEDQQRAIELVGTTAELQFRPVCAVLPAVPFDLSGITDDEGDVETPDTEGQITGEIEPDTPADDVTDPADDTEETGFGIVAGDGEYALGAVPAQDEPSPTELLTDAATPRGLGGINCDADIGVVSGLESTLSEEFRRDEPAIVDQHDDAGNVVSRYYVGPVPSTQIDGETVFLVGSAIQDAQAVNTGFEALVLLTMREGDAGIRLFNDTAQECFGASSLCPTRQLAVVLDGNVESAPTIQAPAFERDSIQISGGFDQERAENTALVLRYGSLPVELEQQQVRTVSSSLGSDSLRAGIISGVIGLLLVATYMIVYYRLLGVAALLSLAVSGALLWVLISFFSETGFFFSGVTLTIAGVVGLIVSMGVSLDSNVVYFEHVKEDIASGRTLRSAVDRSFPVAYRTIFYADMAALIGAVILYTLTTASVREFALMLGLASVLDLVATYFFLRPLVRLLSRTQRAVDHPGLMGLPAAPSRART